MQDAFDIEIAQSGDASAGLARPVGGKLLRHRTERYRRPIVVLTLVFSDVLLALLAWEAASGLYNVWRNGAIHATVPSGLMPSVAVWIGLRGLLGLYPGYGLDQIEELRRQTYAGLVASAIIAVFAFSSTAEDASGWPIMAGFVGLLLLTPVTRYFVKRVMLRVGLWGRPVAVLGSHEVVANLLRVLREEWQLGLNPVVVFGNLPARRVKALESIHRGDVLTRAMELSREQGVDTLILAMPHTRREDLKKLVGLASTCFRSVIVMPNLGGITNSAVVARDFAGSLGVEIRHCLLDPWARRTKRALDLLATVVGGLLISPLLIAVVVLVKLDSPGPAFYGHRRLGADGKHFRCWKFRTMHLNAEHLLDEFLQDNPHLRAEWEQNFKLRNDPRVTRVGSFLRKSSLDELPQLWNVLWGEMSLVGPRPIVDAEIPKYGTVYEMYRRIMPGISGFWQVSGRSDTGYTERVNLDAYYVHNWSVWLDLVILARTIRSVILSKGAY